MIQEASLCFRSKRNQRVDFARSSLIHLLYSPKKYHDLKSRYWWYGTKRVVAECIALYDNCQRVKVECQRHAGLLQPLKIPQ
jgi:hypothetical protein